MALTKNITLESGINLPNAYIKISNIVLNNKILNESFIDVTVNIYKDETARNDLKQEVIQFSHRCSGTNFINFFNLDILNQLNKNIVSQCYEWLKTLPLYLNAIDVVDIKEV